MTNDILPVDNILDLSEAMTNMDGDAELLHEIVEIFMATTQPRLATIRQGIQDVNANQVAVQAHAIKGGAANFCARRFVASALKLELLAKSGSLAGAESMLDQMCTDFDDVAEVIKVVNWDEVARNWQE